MIVEQINNTTGTQSLDMPNVSSSYMVCKIELTLTEAKAIIHSLGRTMCKGDELTISIELEDKLFDVIKKFNYHV